VRRGALNPRWPPADEFPVPTKLVALARRRTARIGVVVAVLALALGACLPPPPATPAPATPAPPPATPATDSLPTPSWWNGACDSGNYAGAHPLGASYRGVPVCGPRPGADHAPNRPVQFFPGAWGELE
jgi:hypothetical protein